MKNQTYWSLAEFYQKNIGKLLHNPTYRSAPRGEKIHEELNVCFTLFDPELCLIQTETRPTPKKYLARELCLYYLMMNQIESFSHASSFWKKIQNNDNTVNSAYGYLVNGWHNKYAMTQWDWATNCLLNDPDSRQAILHYNTPDHQWGGNKDFVCTMSNQFFIRNNQLHMTTYIRSQDIHFGMYFDIPFFYTLMENMRLELLFKYPDLEIGQYTHFCGSLHMYERNFQTYKNMLEEDIYASPLPAPQTILWGSTYLEDIWNDDFSSLHHTYDPLIQWIGKSLKN